MRRAVYALYRGEVFVDVGTAEELAERRGVTPDYIRWLSTPTARKRRKKMLAYRIKDEDCE